MNSNFRLRMSGHAQLEIIMDLSACLLERAREGDWDTVAHIDVQRRGLIHQYFSNSPEPENESQVSTALQELQKMNAQVLELAMQRRRILRDALCALGQGRSALRAYAESQHVPK